MTSHPRPVPVTPSSGARPGTPCPTSSRWCGAARVLGWVAVLAAAHLVVARTGTVLTPPTGLAPDRLVEWAGADPVLLAFSALRLLALALLWYLTALTALAAASRLTGLAPLARLTWAIALPATRRHVARAVGVGFTAGVIVPVGALGLSGAALAQTAEPVVTMHVVDEAPAPTPPDPGSTGALTPAPGPPVRMALVDTGPSPATQMPEHGAAPDPTPAPGPGTTPADLRPAPAPDAAADAAGTSSAATGATAAATAGRDRTAAPVARPAPAPLVMRLVPDTPGAATRADPAAPSSVDPPGSPNDPAATPTPTGPSTGAGPATPTVWTIAPGDHLWHVAEATLTAGWGHRPDERAVAAYWRRLLEHNADRLVVAGEPDLVLPGQVFDLPPLPEPTT